MTDDLNALAARCEAATGPDRELARDLIRAFGLRYPLPKNLTSAKNVATTAADPTRKVTDARALFPCRVRLLSEKMHSAERGDYWVTSSSRANRSDPPQGWIGRGKTKALSICSAAILSNKAALRARAQQEGQR